jgi:hypothetical protein
MPNFEGLDVIPGLQRHIHLQQTNPTEAWISRIFTPGEPLWLSGKVMEWENKQTKYPGFTPQPGQPFKKNLHLK